MKEFPSVELLEQELFREKYKKRYRQVLRGTIYMLITSAASAILIVTLFFPVMRIYGSSMEPTLAAGNIVVAFKTNQFQHGDIIAFYYNNKILIKRVVAISGEWINIDSEGNVFVDGVNMKEPYLSEKALGECNIELPYQVTENRLFVMGDYRATSIDSRHNSVGTVSEEQIIGKLLFRVWPLKKIERIGKK